MTLTLHKRIAFVYRLGTFLSLLLMTIATIELFILGSGAEINTPSVMPIIIGVVQGDAIATYYAAVVVLIFSPLLNLSVMAFTYLQGKEFRFAITAAVVLVIMVLAMFFKVGH